MASDEPTQLLGGLLTRLQSNARGSRLPQLPALGPASPELLQSLGEMQRDGVEQFVETGDFAMMPPMQSITSMREELTSKSTRTVDKLTIELSDLGGNGSQTWFDDLELVSLPTQKR